ncbi:alkene reductase [Deinococcus sp. Arct2-2]|uniref:alkene reductase n=1 Tax=Deinococcus sp. Arct2-2 TaxID=2568653 RepID=UPI0010A2F2B9|nr:alkene reductase [Deinococcus sp. Arct2-2]THF68520.1 alkene reductase [Deinococcus sp. Arct2-2]
MTTLFDRLPLGSLTLPNRIVMAPMTRARATADGLPTAAVAHYYAQRASAGLIVSEGNWPNPQGQSNPNTPGLYRDDQVAAWRPVTAAVHANGGRIFAQLQHAGRVGHPNISGHTPVAPSPVALSAQLYTSAGMVPAPVPRELSTAEVAGEVQGYAEAARRAIDAGFDGVELHGANGYLIQQFLSSNVNLRTDRYGGSVAGRIRFAVEVVQAVAAAIGADRLGLRLSPGAHIWEIEEEHVSELYTALLSELAPLGLAYVHLTATANDDLLLTLRRVWPGTLIVNPSNLMDPGATATDRATGDHWLAQGADLIAFGRAYLANPDLVERLRANLPLTPADSETYYAGGDQGYLNYTSHQH